MEDPKENLPLADEDESFVILGSSPSNLFSHINFTNSKSNSHVSGKGIQESGLDVSLRNHDEGGDDKNKYTEVLPSPKDSLTVIAHFKLGLEGTTPSISSMTKAESIITENSDLTSMQISVGRILDENILLKEKIQEKSDSFKEHFKSMCLYHEDMLSSHKLAVSQFDDTKNILVKLRKENHQLRSELLSKSLHNSLKLEQKTPHIDTQLEKSINGVGNNKNSSPNTSVYEFVVKSDEDTVDKLTGQLELVEKQRRQVIADNEKLRWQIESMDGTITQLAKDKHHMEEALNGTITQLTKDKNHMGEDLKKIMVKLEAAEAPRIDETALKKQEERNANLVSQLKLAQLKILELENAKLNHSVQKNNTYDHIKHLKSNIQELQARLRDAHTVVFQPLRYSLSLEGSSDKNEFGNFEADVKIFDRTLKHLSDFLNLNSRSVCEVCEAVNTSLLAVNNKMNSEHSEELNEGLSNLKLIVQSQQDKLLEQTSQIKATLTIFEKIFQNYQDILKLLKTEREEKERLFTTQQSNKEVLTKAESELTVLRGLVASLKDHFDEKEAFRTQLEIYKTDFETEQRLRQQLTSERDSAVTDLRMLHRRHQVLQEEVEALNKACPENRARPLSVAGVSSVPKSKYTASPTDHVYKCSKCLYQTMEFALFMRHIMLCMP